MQIAAGIGIALLFWGAIRVWYGLKLKLFLVSSDSPVKDQAYIAINTPNRKRTLLRTLARREWKEPIDVTLADYDSSQYSFAFVHHLWRRYRLVPQKLSGPVTVNGRPCEAGRSVALKTGHVIQVGDRRYSVVITTFKPGQFGLIDGERFSTL